MKSPKTNLCRLAMKLLIFSIGLFANAAVAQVNNLTHPGTGPYATIQSAISNAATVDGDVIQVDTGMYTEAITVSKALTIKGPNAGVSGTGTRAVILPISWTKSSES
jgi:pectin methylesterase-like acyl-CoA thioesterase